MMSHSLFPAYFQRNPWKDWASSGKLHARVDYSGFCKWHGCWQQQWTYISALLERGLTSHSVRSSIRAKLGDESSIYHALTFSNFRAKPNGMKGSSVQDSHMSHIQWSESLWDMLKWKRMLNKIHKRPRGMFSRENLGFPYRCSVNLEHIIQTMACRTWCRCVVRTCTLQPAPFQPSTCI